MRVQTLYKNFRNPTLVLIGIILYGLFYLLNLHFFSLISIFAAIIFGSYSLFLETWKSLLKRQFALDYIAILAVIVSIIAGEYLVASIIALMISSGVTLEEYGARQAKKSLVSLIDRIPQQVILWENNAVGQRIPIAKVKIGQQIFVRTGEVIPLDGALFSGNALIDESSLTGEPYPIDKTKDNILRSGTVNMGEAIISTVTKAEADSTYRSIIDMVQKAQNEKAPLVRLADKYSTFFTIITLIIAVFAYFNGHGLDGVLAVLVIATPCPLIIATPIALMGGVNAAAKKRIIVKTLSALERLARVDTVIFDKTGTLTLGQPQFTQIDILSSDYSKEKLLAIASEIEKNSLHPIAKAIVAKAKEITQFSFKATSVKEELGKGISGEIDNKVYTIRNVSYPHPSSAGLQVEVLTGKTRLALIYFTDVLKKDSNKIINNLKKLGYELLIFTGDRKDAAEKILASLGSNLEIRAGMSPQDKQQGVQDLKKEHKIVAMFGDGINDAPALALADVGIVFSNDEQTAASEAADIVLLGGSLQMASDTLTISKRTVSIALQSILWGIGLSIVGMLLAAFGLIPPLIGAGLQEVIDVAVILNALRASRTS